MTRFIAIFFALLTISMAFAQEVRLRLLPDGNLSPVVTATVETVKIDKLTLEVWAFGTWRFDKNRFVGGTAIAWPIKFGSGKIFLAPGLEFGDHRPRSALLFGYSARW